MTVPRFPLHVWAAATPRGIAAEHVLAAHGRYRPPTLSLDVGRLSLTA